MKRSIILGTGPNKTKENPVKHIAIDVIRFVKPAMDKVKSL